MRTRARAVTVPRSSPARTTPAHVEIARAGTLRVAVAAIGLAAVGATVQVRMLRSSRPHVTRTPDGVKAASARRLEWPASVAMASPENASNFLTTPSSSVMKMCPLPSGMAHTERIALEPSPPLSAVISTPAFKDHARAVPSMLHDTSVSKSSMTPSPVTAASCPWKTACSGRLAATSSVLSST